MTLREVFIQALMARFQAAPGFPALVERSILTAFGREEGLVVVVHRGSEGMPDASRLGVVDRECEVLVSVLARGSAPDQDADTVLEVIHPLVMTYTHPRIMDVTEGVTDMPKFADADGTAGMITVRYIIKYRTTPNSLTS